MRRRGLRVDRRRGVRAAAGVLPHAQSIQRPAASRIREVFVVVALDGADRFGRYRARGLRVR